jgi:hypothetical protein
MKPRPEVHTVILWNSTLGRPTMHDYVTTRECHVRGQRPDGEFRDLEPAWEHIYRCRVNDRQERR